jgi:hypothetical protein
MQPTDAFVHLRIDVLTNTLRFGICPPVELVIFKPDPAVLIVLLMNRFPNVVSVNEIPREALFAESVLFVMRLLDTALKYMASSLFPEVVITLWSKKWFAPTAEIPRSVVPVSVIVFLLMVCAFDMTVNAKKLVVADENVLLYNVLLIP